MKWILPRYHRVHLVDSMFTISYGQSGDTARLEWFTPEEAMRVVGDATPDWSKEELREQIIRTWSERGEDELYRRQARGFPVDPPIVERHNYLHLRSDGMHRTANAGVLGFDRVPVVIAEVDE